MPPYTGILVLSWAIGIIASIHLGASTAVAQASPTGAARPNLLLVTFDTTRADRLPIYGYRGARTPGIERLAREGVVFTRAYAPTVQTLPSHASLMTGLLPITTGVVSNGQRLEPEVLTLAEILKASGYRTGAIVATAPLMEVFGLSQGFDLYNDNFEESAISRMVKSVFRLFSTNRVNVRSTRPAQRVAALGRTWLRKAARGDQPFFLWLHFIEPHAPYEGHPDFTRPKWVVEDGRVNAFGVKEANYVSEIAFADHHLGTVLRELDDLGLTANTLTVLTADHGESLGEQGYTGHREEVFERIIRVPLVLRMPARLPAGRRIETPVQLPDVTPTILDLLGIALPADAFQGRNLFKLPSPPRKLFAIAVKLFTRSPIRIAMVEGDRKFVYWPDTGRRALFDLAADPAETRNLLTHTETQEASGLAEVRDWWDRHERLGPGHFQLESEDRERLRSLGYVR